MRQAVVVIHGIGEQRPMSTLRQFVAHVLPVAEQNQSRTFSKPDRMSESFELRRLSVEKSPRRDIAHDQFTRWPSGFDSSAQGAPAATISNF